MQRYMETILKVSNISKTYRAAGRVLTVLEHISFTVEAGSTMAIVGPSGSGKTTLLGLCAGLDRCSDGSVQLNGIVLESLDEDERAVMRNRYVGFIFQNFQLLPTLTALENVMVPMELRGEKGVRERAKALMGKVGLEDRLHHYPAQLSGGEQQRVSLARAFAGQPRILFADEPTGNLDAETSEKIVQLLFELNREAGTTLIIVTHNLELAAATQRVIRLAGEELSTIMKKNNGLRPSWLFVMAWRDSRRNRGRLFLFISSVVLGIAALVATLSFGNNLREDVDDQAKELVGADLVLRGRHGVRDSVLGMKVFAGALRSEGKSMPSMVYFPRSQSSRLVQLIGLSGDYPYYGKIETKPASAAMDFRGKRAALVDQTLMLEFGARVGDSIRVGTLDLVIAGALIKMPGRNQVSLTVAAPVYIPLRYVDSAGLEKKGSQIESEVYYRFKPGTDMSKLMETLGPELDSAHVRYETVEMRKERMTRAFKDLSQFLTLISFIALLLGCIGVASAVNIYIREKITGVAVLRCLGLKARTAFVIYLIQILGIGLFGSLLGAGLGVVVQQVLPMLFKEILPVEAHFRLSWPAIGEGVAIGVAIALLFALLPLLTVRKISPLNTLRLSVESAASGWDGWKAAVYTAVFVFITWFSYARMEKFGKALIFTLSILGAFLLLAGAAKLLMAAVRRFFPERWNYLWRQGFANLYRPNNQTLILVVTIGLGTTFIGTLFFIQELLLERVSNLASTDGNMVLYDVQSAQIAGVRRLASEMKVRLVDDVPIVAVRVTSIKGITRGDEGAGQRRIDYDTRVTYSDTLRPTEKLVAGKLRGGRSVHRGR